MWTGDVTAVELPALAVPREMSFDTGLRSQRNTQSDGVSTHSKALAEGRNRLGHGSRERIIISWRVQQRPPGGPGLNDPDGNSAEEKLGPVSQRQLAQRIIAKQISGVRGSARHSAFNSCSSDIYTGMRADDNCN